MWSHYIYKSKSSAKEWGKKSRRGLRERICVCTRGEPGFTCTMHKYTRLVRKRRAAVCGEHRGPASALVMFPRPWRNAKEYLRRASIRDREYGGQKKPFRSARLALFTGWLVCAPLAPRVPRPLGGYTPRNKSFIARARGTRGGRVHNFLISRAFPRVCPSQLHCIWDSKKIDPPQMRDGSGADICW